jgi:sulfotransferase
MDRPASCMSHVYAWLGVSALVIDPDKLAVGAQESDSHYRKKYPHAQAERIIKPKQHDIPPRIQAQIESACAWFYQLYYPSKS